VKSSLATRYEETCRWAAATATDDARDPVALGDLVFRDVAREDVATKHVAQVLKVENRLTNLWASFRADRLALYRELGVLPYNDWNSFYADLSARPQGANTVPAGARQPGPGNAPPPPGPPPGV
jgi:hypothetical protein